MFLSEKEFQFESYDVSYLVTYQPHLKCIGQIFLKLKAYLHYLSATLGILLSDFELVFENHLKQFNAINQKFSDHDGIYTYSLYLADYLS